MTNPIVTAYRKHADRARRHLPGGHLLAVDREGICRRIARDHGMTPEAVREIVEKADG